MCSRLLVVFFLLCVFAPLLAQTPNDPTDEAPTAQAAQQTKPPAHPPETSSITGTVLCNDTRLPARGALVVAESLSKNNTISPSFSGIGRVGIDGTYVISSLSAGNYLVLAILPGYISPFDNLPLGRDPTSQAAMQAALTRNAVVSVRNNETAHFDVTIQRGAIVRGRVLYDDGAPATQVAINLEDVNAKPTANTLGTAGNAGADINSLLLHQNQGTDDEGNFRIAGIKPGTYRIVATPSTTEDQFGAQNGIAVDRNSQSPHIYAGDTLHKNAARTYTLRAGEETSGIEITIPVYAFHRVAGHLTTPDGHPIIAASITLTDSSDDSFVFRSSPSRDGGFAFPEVSSGTYKLAVTGAKLGTVPDNWPDGVPVLAMLLQNVQSFADTTTTILVKDSDITDLSIQLQNAPPASNQPIGTPAPTAAPQ